jgi:uncharacterized repeat protein (TIGR03803 family)
MAPSGTLYGTTTNGGYNMGTVYELVPNGDKSKWAYHRLHGFCKTCTLQRRLRTDGTSRA